MQEWLDKFSVLISWANLKSILREGGQNINSKDKILDFCVDIHTSLWFFKIWGGHGPPQPIHRSITNHRDDMLVPQ